MPRKHRSRTSAAGAALILSLLALALAACGSGGKSTSSATAAVHTTPGAPAGASTAKTKPSHDAALKQLSAGVEKLRACLAKYGVPLPRATNPGQAGGLFGNGKSLPKGVTLPQAEAALERCAGKSGNAKSGPITGPANGVGSNKALKSLNGKALKGLGRGKALTSGLVRLFDCLRQQGLKLAEANDSLGGLAKLNLQDPKVRKAIETCSKQAKAGK